MKKFLRSRLYRHEQMQAARIGAGKVLEELFEGFMARRRADAAGAPGRGARAGAANGRAGRARAVADYIAGMTDRYAFQEHGRLLA